MLPKYARVCFEKGDIRVLNKPMADLIHPAHPLMGAVIDMTLEDTEEVTTTDYASLGTIGGRKWEGIEVGVITSSNFSLPLRVRRGSLASAADGSATL